MVHSVQIVSSQCVESAADVAVDEAELVRECLSGSARACREFVGLHSKRIYNFVYQMTRQQQDAEDITQQTFIKAFKSLHRFDPQRPIANWLYTIARRTALNHFRASKQWVEMPKEVASDGPSPAGEVEEKDEIKNLWEHARQRLSRREFEVLWLRFAENLSTAETSKITGLTQTYVKVLTHRARNHLMESHIPL